ncbi:MAG: hypothetical protein AAFQ68_20085 [Bacteroidota bacterium]
MAETNEKASALIETADGGSNIDIPNYVSGLIIEKAKNHDQQFRFCLKNEAINHLSSWDQEGGRVLVWHYIVNGILVSRHLSPSLDAWSPYFFIEDKGRGSCVIGRIYRTDFNPSIAEDHFNIGNENPAADANMHICVSRKKRQVLKSQGIGGESIPDFDEDAFTDGIWYKTDSNTDLWKGEAPFLVHAEAGDNQVRLSYDPRFAVQDGIPYVPIWFVYNQGKDRAPAVFIDDSPIVEFPELRKFYNNNREKINQWYEHTWEFEENGKTKYEKNWLRLSKTSKADLPKLEKDKQAILPHHFAALKAAGIHVCLRYYIGVSIPGMREGDVGHGKPGGPPPPPSGGDGF